MVTNITNLGRSGLSDWLIQRISAVILAVYALFMVLYLLAPCSLLAELASRYENVWGRRKPMQVARVTGANLCAGDART